ncbi:MAG: hypothetical protein R3Y28_04845 [Candidatus Gastranaerophilales bacterium]
MAKVELDYFFSNNGTRNEVRTRVINKFLEEIPGTGNGENQSKYLYYVENVNFSNNEKIKNAPTHDNIFEDLKVKKTEEPLKYQKLYSLIEEVYNCNEINDGINLEFNSGYNVDLLLKVIKWFFIEQDIRYWNYSGRSMTMNGIPTP